MFGLDTDMVSMEIELGEDGEGTGNMVIEFTSPQKAIDAANHLDRFILAKKNTFTALTFNDYKNIIENKTQQEAPVFKTRKQLGHWRQLKGVELSLLAYNEDSYGLVTFNTLKKSLVAKKKYEFGDMINNVSFSKSGNYLVVYYHDRFELYGAMGLKKITQFYHKKVKKVEFSPNEDYLMSFNGTVSDTGSPENIVVWNLYTGKKLRIFKLLHSELERTFSFDSTNRYACGIQQIGENRYVFVFELETMILTEDPKTGKRCQIDAQNPINCAWSPSGSFLAVGSGILSSTGEKSEGKRSGVSVYELPSRKKLNWVNSNYKILDINLQWATFTNILHSEMIIRLKKKNEKLVQAGYVDQRRRQILVSTVESIEKAEIPEVIYSPNGQHMIVLTEDDKKKFRVDFITVENNGNDNYKMKVLDTLQKQRKKDIYFCPFSRFVLIVENKTVLISEFKTVKDKVEFKLVKEIEVGAYDKLKWSPCGRFFGLTKKSGTNTELTIYDIFGRLAATQLFTDANKIIWRSFPLINDYKPDEKKIQQFKDEIKKNYAELCDEDVAAIDIFKAAEKTRRKEMFDEFKSYFADKLKVWENSKAYRISKLGYDEDVLDDYETRTRVDKEELITEIQIILEEDETN